MDIEFEIQNFIGGRFLEADKFLNSYDPSTGKVWARIPDSGTDEVELAVSAAKSAFSKWSNTPVEERSQILLKIAYILDSRLEEFAEVESRDQGKPVALARRVDIPRAVYNFRFFASSVLNHVETSTYLDGMNALNYTTRMPLGVAGLISPWNLPLYLLTFKMAPALAFGNTVVCKPSEMTSISAWMLCEIFDKAGVPPGVINMVFGTGQKAGDALVRHPDVPLISFTGGTATAIKIREATASCSKKLSLELGGKNAAIIFSDADLSLCIPTTIRSCFTNQGEVCLCTSRIFVHRSIYDVFVPQFVSATRKLQVGDPRAENTDIGALISQEHLNKVRGYVQLARYDGATIECGDGVDPLYFPEAYSNGYYMRPTVITDISVESRLMQEEIFGPVVCIVPFDTEQEVIDAANSVKYGLCAAVWTQDLSRSHRVARQLEVGTVWTNCWLIRDLRMPFGGMKASGTGREGAEYSLDFFTELKTVCLKI